MSEQKQLPALMTVPRFAGIAISSPEDLMRVGKLMAASRFFGTHENADLAAAQACVKIMAGAEYGFTPFVSMKTMHVIEGTPCPSYQMIITMIKRSGKYDFKIIKREDDGCIIEWFENGVSVGQTKFDKADATRAELLGKKNWRCYPRRMHFSRAITEGANVYCTEIFGGPIYTPGEMNVLEDDNGNPVIDAKGEYVQDADEVDEKKKQGRKVSSKPSSSDATNAAESATSSVTDVQVKEVQPDPKSSSCPSSQQAQTTSTEAAGTTAQTASKDSAGATANPKSTSSPNAVEQKSEQPTSNTSTAAPDPKPASGSPSAVGTQSIARPGDKELADVLNAGTTAGLSQDDTEAFFVEFLEKKGVDCSSTETIYATWTFEIVAEAINELIAKKA